MKTFNRFIIEKLKLGKNIQINKYHFYPKDFKELRSLIEQLLEERGKDADLNDIDVSKITMFVDTTLGDYNDLGLFEKLDPHNIDISEWDVSNVEDMHRLFFECFNFNCDLSKWNVKNVTSFSNTFYCCENFTGKGLENWDVSNAESMFGMFVDCKKFNSDLKEWNTKKCKSMAHMFNGCKKFDCDLSDWDISSVEEKFFMFHKCEILRTKKLIPDWYY